ncbi:conserved hypothetical protein [Ricinus communis]|uniref:Uncharacterized protein n=1 Tax=Ricinus communis TaxID=3988 RepID=B9SXQ1_RICCO|nr:conserved hypothetical protein [Ricinus communis]
MRRIDRIDKQRYRGKDVSKETESRDKSLTQRRTETSKYEGQSSSDQESSTDAEQ